MPEPDPAIDRSLVRWLFVFVPLLLLAAAAAACGDGWTPSVAQPDSWTQEEGFRWRELRVPEVGRPGFRQVPASRTGLVAPNTLSEASLLENQIRSNGSGLAIGDVDGDGRPDVYLARLDGPNELHLNRGDWEFEEAAARWGVAAEGRFSTGVALADVNGDGRLDLLSTALGGPNSVWLNRGNGSFADPAPLGPGGGDGAGTTTLALADIDGDGDLDLYTANYKRASVNDLFSPSERALSRTIVTEGGRTAVAPAFREHYEIGWRANELRRWQIGEPDRLYLNRGDGTFRESTGRFRDSADAALAELPRDWGLAARFQDLDGDRDPDLYVCNDFQSPDRLWLNREGVFAPAPAGTLDKTSASCMSVDAGDLDQDGRLDLFAVDMRSQRRERQKTQIPVVPNEGVLPGVRVAQQVQRNVLLLGRGDGSFAEAALQAGVDASGWSWSTALLDVDLDGDLDALIPNGHLHDVLDADRQVRIQNTALTDWRRSLLMYDPLRERNVAFRNDGALRFTEVGEAWGFGTVEDISHAIATGDLDGDGDLDVVVNRLGDPPLVLRNEATAPRLAVRLSGAAPNTGAVGSVIRVRSPGLPDQRTEVISGGRYLSDSEALYSFAANENEPSTIVVEWRHGGVTRIEDAHADRLYEIDEASRSSDGEGLALEPASAVSDARWFEPAAPALDHLHVDLPYGDFNRQPLLPERLSRAGPGAAWVDWEQDGDPDLLIGAGRGGAPAFFRNDGGTLRGVALPTGASPVDQSGVLGLRFGARTVALIGLFNHEAPDPRAAADLPGVLRLEIDPASLGRGEPRVGFAPVVAGAVSGTGPLSSADYDQDGDLDLFVGGRARVGAYPEPATSRLLINQGGRLVVDSANAAALDEIGLVSASTFSDTDGDGDQDLVLALDWGPVRVLVNDEGSFRDATSALGLAGFTGRWNGVTTGDVDGDGRLDILATSWGRNTGVSASPDGPYRLYYGDLDANGTVDVIPAAPDRSGAYMPDIGLGRLRAALPALMSRFDTFARYATATMDEVLGPVSDRARVLEVTRLDHTVFLNRGQRFEARSLPAGSQLAPAFHVGVQDLNGDGREDVYLGQNFSGTAPEAERHDAGRGLILQGDGRGDFTALGVAESGVDIAGDQRAAAAADYDRDGRVDLVFTVNGGAARLYHNRMARPGYAIRLVDGPGNPSAVGAWLRLEAAGARGAVREIKAGGGYWGQDEAVQVLSSAGPVDGLWVRWPDGQETRHPLPVTPSPVVIRRTPR